MAKIKCQSCGKWNCKDTICKRWLTAELNGLVRLEWVPDEHMDIEDLEGDSYNPAAHPDMDPAQLAEERQDFIRKCESEGVWGLCGQYRLDAESDVWRNSDSIWGLVGQDDAGYMPDIKAATLDALEKAQGEAAEKRATLREVASAVCGYRQSTKRALAWALQTLKDTE